MHQACDGHHYPRVTEQRTKFGQNIVLNAAAGASEKYAHFMMAAIFYHDGGGLVML